MSCKLVIMTLNLRDVKDVDNRTKMLINGFNREARQLFPQDIPYYNIPSIVNHFCLLFYWQRDYFKILDNDDITLSDDKLEAKVSDTTFKNWNTLYGAMIFDDETFQNTIIEYEVAPNREGQNFGAIGIVSAGEEQENVDKLTWSGSNHKQVCCWHCSTGSDFYSIGSMKVVRGDGFGDCYHHSNEDKFRVTIDIKDKSVTFWSITKGKEIGTYFGVDYSIKYRFAVSMTKGSSIKILSVKFSQKQ